MAHRIRTLLFICLLSAPALLQGQDGSEYRGWSFSQRFQGSSNAAGLVLKTSSTTGYAFNRNVKVYAGVPVYFARETSSSGDTSFMNGIGNVYSGIVLNGNAATFHYSSDLVATVPTGDRNRGFSTGHATLDWTNTFSRSFDKLTPYASIGAANTISDTSFFVRPFSSKGIVSHFEAGALMDIAPRVSVGASAYGVRATGEQEIISKVVEQQSQGGSAQQKSQNGVLPGVVRNTNLVPLVTNNSGAQRTPAVFETVQQTVGPAGVANDHGFSTWLMLQPTPFSDFEIGYSRSTTYQFDSLFFGLGFRIGH